MSATLYIHIIKKSFKDSAKTILLFVLILFLHKSYAQPFEKIFHNPNNDSGRGISITSDNKILMTGIISSNVLSSENSFILKTELNGNILWSKKFSNNNAVPVIV